MNINELLKGMECECGRHHTCDIDCVYVESGAVNRLSEICEDYGHVLLVADENTFAAAANKVLSVLEDKNVKTVIFSGKEILIPDEAAIKAVTDKLSGAEIIIGVGSGVIQDLCKYVSSRSLVPYIIVATAPSMDGYASNGAAMITDGMKVTYPAGLPVAIIGDLDVLKNAPLDMIKAGYGDIIGKFSALNDWKLSRLINGEYFCNRIYDITYGQIQSTVRLARGLLKRDEESIKALTEALIVIGIMMSFAGSSRPASGSEHHLSHFFEITGILNSEKYFPHGIDVAYSTVITSELRERLLMRAFPERIYRLKEADYRRVIKEIYSSVSDACAELQSKAGNYKNDRSSVYVEKETEIKRILAEAPSANEIKKMLLTAELDIKDFYTLYSERKIAQAVSYAKDLKDRYTVLWLYYDLLGDSENV